MQYFQSMLTLLKNDLRNNNNCLYVSKHLLWSRMEGGERGGWGMSHLIFYKYEFHLLTEWLENLSLTHIKSVSRMQRNTQ